MSASAAADQSSQSEGGRPAVGKLISVALAVCLVALVAGAAWVYSSEERGLAELRQANAALSADLAKSQQEAQASQVELNGVREQLARSQAEASEAQASGKALGDQLAQAQQQSQAAEATARDLRVTSDELGARLAREQQATKDAQANSATLNQKMAKALARAQLIDEVFKFSTSGARGDEANQQGFAWIRKLSSLNDPTINKYLDALAKDPNDSKTSGQLLSYLSGSVVDELR